jgi:hypothetical protein
MAFLSSKTLGVFAPNTIGKRAIAQLKGGIRIT